MDLHALQTIQHLHGKGLALCERVYYVSTAMDSPAWTAWPTMWPARGSSRRWHESDETDIGAHNGTGGQVENITGPTMAAGNAAHSPWRHRKHNIFVCCTYQT